MWPWAKLHTKELNLLQLIFLLLLTWTWLAPNLDSRSPTSNNYPKLITHRLPQQLSHWSWWCQWECQKSGARRECHLKRGGVHVDVDALCLESRLYGALSFSFQTTPFNMLFILCYGIASAQQRKELLKMHDPSIFVLLSTLLSGSSVKWERDWVRGR